MLALFPGFPYEQEVVQHFDNVSDSVGGSQSKGQRTRHSFKDLAGRPSPHGEAEVVVVLASQLETHQPVLVWGQRDLAVGVFEVRFT